MATGGRARNPLPDVQSDAVLEAMEEARANGGAAAAPKPNDPPLKGYPKKSFLNAREAEKFLCMYCDNVLRSPLQSECGHRFCQGCKDEMLTLPSPVRCKACDAEEHDPDDIDDDTRGILDLTSMFSDKAAIREMRRLEVKCPNQLCSWKGQFAKYVEHETSCEFRPVVCELCNKMVAFNKLEEHKKNQCPKRPYTCPYCKEKLTFDQKEAHKSVCTNAPIRCDKCSKEIPRKEMEHHKLYECPNREIECPVPECKAKLPRHQFHTHFNRGNDGLQKHMSWLYERIGEINEQMNRIAVPDREGSVGGAAASSSAVAQVLSQPVAAGGGGNGGDGAAAAAPAPGPYIPTDIKQKLKLHEDLMSVLHGEILRCIQQIEALSREIANGNTRVQGLTVKVDAVERRLTAIEAGPQADAGLTGEVINCNDGAVVWKIPQFSQLRRTAVDETRPTLVSPSFYTHPQGYKMRLRMFPNGDGQAKNNAVSVFMQLQRGDCDDLLVWPFAAKVYMMLIDQKDFRNHVVDSFQSRSNLAAFKKPTSPENSATGCQKLVTIDRLTQNLASYVVNDTIYIKMLVEQDALSLDRVANLDPRTVQANRR